MNANNSKKNENQLGEYRNTTDNLFQYNLTNNITR